MMLTDVKRLRVGIISATNDLYAWEVECIRRLSRLDFVSLAVFAIRDGPAAARSHRESRLFPDQCPNALRGVRPDECFRQYVHSILSPQP